MCFLIQSQSSQYWPSNGVATYHDYEVRRGKEGGWDGGCVEREGGRGEELVPSGKRGGRVVTMCDNCEASGLCDFLTSLINTFFYQLAQFHNKLLNYLAFDVYTTAASGMG